ncbi:MAG: metal-dependent transcriptional regulator [archaeon]
MNVSIEDYMRTIFGIYERQPDKTAGIKAIDVSCGLKVSKPSVSEMIRKLFAMGYIRSRPYSRIFLTKKGLNEAKRIMHNHRVIEVFLKKVLRHEGCVHEEAHRLEHAFSEESVRRLDSYLKHPKTCPDGQEIPHDSAF